MNIAVLAGGTSSERNVSLVSAAAMARAAVALGHRVRMVDTATGQDIDYTQPAAVGETPPDQTPPAESGRIVLALLHRLADDATDVIINGLHGGTGENGMIQAACEWLGLRFTGSGVMASALAMNKVVSKQIFLQAGVPTAPYLFFRQSAAFKTVHDAVASAFHYPIVVKPNEEGSTVGLTIVKEERELQSAWVTAKAYGDVLMETYIPGRELTVAILRGRAMPVIEIKPEGGFYDYLHKYTKGKTTYECPAALPETVTRDVQSYAEKAFAALQCSGYARVDFRCSPENALYCLEVNTLPGMTETSLVPKAAGAVGISFDALIGEILAAATEAG